MPDFRIEPANVTSGTLWKDPASITRPSRITDKNAQQHRYFSVDAALAISSGGIWITLNAILAGQVAPQDDTDVGLFTSWCIEYPSVAVPQKNYPDPAKSSIVEWKIDQRGHYLFAMRHEDTQNGPDAAAGGVILFHLDSIG